MPKLLAFMPCEKVLEDKNTNNISLISVMQSMTLEVPRSVLPLPEGAIAPQMWSIFAMWAKERDERPSFSAKTELYLPNGKLAMETATAHVNFENCTVESQRLIMMVQGFPIGAPGTIQLVLKIKDGLASEFEELARFPVTIKHEPTDVPSGIGTPIAISGPSSKERQRPK